MNNKIKIGILVLLIVIFFILLKSLSEHDMNNLNTAITSLTASWSDRAQSSVVRTTDNSKEALAGAIIGSLHPTASSPRLESYDVVKNGDIINVYYNCRYNGGFTGNDYSLKLKWSFSKNQNFGVLVLSDTSPISYDADNFDNLKNYFQSEIYPVVLGNIK